MSTQSDLIQNLPVDDTTPSEDEIQIMNILFKKNQKMMYKLLSSLQDIFILGGLFVLFSNSFVDILIRKYIKRAEVPFILVGIKTILFMIVYYIIHNLYLVRI